MTNWTMPHRFMSKTDPAESSADYSRDETYSAPAASRKEFSEDSNSSKFIEAMRNPNWRQRPEDQGSSISPTLTELSFCEVDATESRETAVFDGSAGSNDHRIFQGQVPSDSCPWAPRTENTKSEDRLPPASISATATTAANYLEETGLYEVVKHVKLPDIRSLGKPTSIFELSPHATSERSCFQHQKHYPFRSNMVQVQPMGKENLQAYQGSGYQQRSIAATKPLTTDKKSATLQLPVQRNNEIARSRSPSTIRMEKARKAVLEDPAIADVGISYRDPQPDNDRRDTLLPNNTKAIVNPNLSAKQLAFQKMLERLNKRTLQATGPHQGYHNYHHGQENTYPSQ